MIGGIGVIVTVVLANVLVPNLARTRIEEVGATGDVVTEPVAAGRDPMGPARTGGSTSGASPVNVR